MRYQIALPWRKDPGAKFDAQPARAKPSPPPIHREEQRDAAQTERPEPSTPRQGAASPASGLSRTSQLRPQSGRQAKVVSQVLKNKQLNHNTNVDPVEKLRAALSKFTRSSDRRMIIRTLETSPLLRHIPIRIPVASCANDPELLRVLQEEVSSGALTVNGVAVGGFGLRSHGQYFEFLARLCRRMAGGSAAAGDRLLAALVPHIAPSIHGSDALLQLQALLGGPDLKMQPLRGASPFPTELRLHNNGGGGGGGEVHAEVTTRHPFGLFRRSDLTQGGKRPWVGLIAEVQERVNLTTGDAVRFCRVTVSDKP